ncbi:MAG TPA: chromosome segregation protein SMC, partial [Chitinophagaceae bacterium]|nr:chromosome segregation protein SMC [Chitinophagaceae bacterium]
NSRRRMLEQAAGISIYKTRKKEAKQKLDATEQDLARIEDLLFEINNQLKTLENQARKAEKYYEIKKEYRELSIELAKAALEGFNLTYRDLNEKTEAETNRRVQLEAVIAQEEAGLEKERVGLIDKERALQSMQHQFNDLVQQLRTRENDRNLASQKLNFLQEKQTNLQEFLTKSDGQLKGLEESIAFTQQQVIEEEGKLEALQGSLDERKEQAEEKRRVFDEKRTAVDSLRSENTQLQRSQFDAEKKVAVADTSIQNLQRGIHQVEEEREVRQSQLKQLEEEKLVKEEELGRKKTDLQQLQDQHERTKEQILQTQGELEELRQQLAEEARKLDSKRNEHDLLKSLIDSMEGYPESVKFLHNNPSWNHTAPILSDIIYVKEEYRAAVENVLEPYLNYYVVNNLQEGLQAVHLLDENKKGKANFFLLDKLQGAEAGHQPQDTIPAMNVIEVDAPYKKLAEHLLGNVFIAENEDALANSNGAVVLEKHGKYVKGKYSLTGGSVGLFEGKKIGRAKNLEKLQEEVAALDVVVNRLKDNIQAKHNEVIGHNEQLKDNAIKQTQGDINTLTNQVYSLVNKTENLHALQSTSRNRLEEMQQNLESTHASISGTRSELAELVEIIAENEDKLRQAEEEYKGAELQYNEASTQYNEFNLQLTRQQSKITALKQELEFKNKQIQELNEQIEANASQLKQTAESITESSDLLAGAEEALVGLLRKKEEEERALNEADQAYYNLRNALNEKESELRHKVKEKEQLEQLLSGIKDKLNELKLQLAGMKERLQVEFRINLDDIIDQPRTGETPVEELQEKSERMKKRLDNLGEVNPTAIEAFQEMKKRYEFILEQKNDLVTAKDSLLQTIAEVETTANQKFLDTFMQVKENFIKVFKALFTEEDQCDLVLENPENLAETGIEIIAKPKGKRPSALTQLSGGEKTLTSTALLFAIYLIKPAPFCILDEVDAPLDDANVTKFTQMIRKFSDESQFIIVTHNKTTMSSVDVIYGVTMQEAGVSKLVPVDFRGLSAN